jgi:toxin-antitoxin system PIN domain toxin
MTSCDTNILFPAFDKDSLFHKQARNFLESLGPRADFCLCEQVLMELYCLLRNPVVCRVPLSAERAVSIIQGLRSNPRWRIVDIVPGHGIADQVWNHAAGRSFAYRRLFDARLAMVLKHHGVSEFATRNGADFRDFGFARLWDPFLVT